MKKITLLLISTLLFSESIYSTKVCKENQKAMQNKKITCRWVCDKKIYAEQKIAEAIAFYKGSKDYKFTKEGF